MRSALYQVRKTWSPLSFRAPVAAYQKGQPKRMVQVDLMPIQNSLLSEEEVIGIIFREGEELAEQQPSQFTVDDEAKAIQDLEQELAETKEELQNTIEELETSTEELKASHEEALSTNEELQSANEELEASAEEKLSRRAEQREQQQAVVAKLGILALSGYQLSVIASKLKFQFPFYTIIHRFAGHHRGYHFGESHHFPVLSIPIKPFRWTEPDKTKLRISRPFRKPYLGESSPQFFSFFPVLYDFGLTI